ncbi:hypothetical protein P154DRAFT_39175 [Amniculicola lignicola CBS 123094]|uniref:Uncharacterized protein n=1 Tax=Amniculicola lignicola CBS 123094 TaxID=1392246 RepID=A0A6A5VZQ4_9PLEO|nr:hypothetical protein P154DRAFT_39175 [Amniculicola lignicola CBS 123094]
MNGTAVSVPFIDIPNLMHDQITNITNGTVGSFPFDKFPHFRPDWVVNSSVNGTGEGTPSSDFPDVGLDWITNGTRIYGAGGIPIDTLPQLILDWIAAHPYQTAFYIANGVVYVTPAAVPVPFLRLLGFNANGPVAGMSFTRSVNRNFPTFLTNTGTWAAKIMSVYVRVPAKGVFAHLQSAAMGGYGKAVVAGATKAGAAVNSAGGLLYNFFGNNGTSSG